MKLIMQDVFNFSKVLKTLNINHKIIEIIEKNNNEDEVDKEKVQEKVGIEIVLLLVSEMGNAQDLICELFARPFEIKAEEVVKLEISDFISKTKEIMKANNMSNFLELAAKFSK